MKPMRFDKRLVLNKKTVAHLNPIEMRYVNGGGNPSRPFTLCDCPSTGCPTKDIVICTTF